MTGAADAIVEAEELDNFYCQFHSRLLSVFEPDKRRSRALDVDETVVCSRPAPF
tara:strand:- start:408 stop:569 length:162 start_codon:yes stop_codon:yes gene_type:complete